LPSTTYYWKVRASNDGINYGPWVGNWVFNTQAATVGISELNQDIHMLYPNPANDHVVVKGNSVQIGQVIQIFDHQGRCVQSQIITTNNTQTLSIDKLASGVYLVKVGEEVSTLVKE
jgi:putative heme degradation protein